jgi:Tol biopolymer transport system component
MDLEILNLRSHTVAKVPGSEGLWSPRWSPDGRYIVALTANYDRIMLFDFNSGKWTELARISAILEEWSTKGDSVNFIGRFPGGEEGLFKVAIADHKLQEVVPLKEFRRARGLGGWAGVTPDGAPLTVRNLI